MGGSLLDRNRLEYRRFYGCCLVSIVLGLVLGLVPATVATHDDFVGCAVFTSPGQPTVYRGDDRKNHCSGGGGQDSMFGFGARDILNAGRGDDKTRGATGNDDLIDDAGDGDRDGACDGDGDDITDHRDGDGRDHLHVTQTPGVGARDAYICNCFAGDDADPHSDCPAGFPI
jgi:hypothetical protein